MKEEEGSFDPFRENKGADQLLCYREADQCLCFRICELLVSDGVAQYRKGKKKERTI